MPTKSLGIALRHYTLPPDTSQANTNDLHVAVAVGNGSHAGPKDEATRALRSWWKPSLAGMRIHQPTSAGETIQVCLGCSEGCENRKGVGKHNLLERERHCETSSRPPLTSNVFVVSRGSGSRFPPNAMMSQ